MVGSSPLVFVTRAARSDPGPRWDTTKDPHAPPRPGRLVTLALLALATLAAALSAAPAHANPVHLPLSGLVVELDGDWHVASTWTPSPDPRTPALGKDVVTRGDGAIAYAVRAGGRTDRPCPYASPFVVELGGVPWIHDPTTRSLCRLERDARVEVELLAGPEDPRDHEGALQAFADALAERRVDRDAPPPLSDPRVSRAGDAAPAPLALATIGLTLAPPDDGFVWRVAEARDDRHFDALVRVFPTFPEVQLLVYRHRLRHLASCDDLVRRQAARAMWRVRRGVLERDLGAFRIRDRCSQHASGLLEVRVASAPHLPITPFEPVLAALAAAAAGAPAPRVPSLVPARSHTFRWASGGLALALPESRAEPIVALEVGQLYIQRNGLFLRGMATLGVGGDDYVASASVDAGVALAAAPDLTLALSLGLREDHDPLLENRSLSLGLELHSGFHRDDTFAWALRVLPFHLASRQPSVAGTPLVIAWDGLLPSGVLFGVDLRWVDRPLEPQSGWSGGGLVIGLRAGVGDVRR